MSPRPRRTVAFAVGAPALLLAALLVAPAVAPRAEQALAPRLEGEALVAALSEGGHVLLMRHAPTDPVPVDPETFDVRDCATQRNLSEEGREKARAMGQAIAKLGVPIGEVYASPYCRCLETGKLVFGRVEELDLLSVWDTLSVDERSERGGQVRELLSRAPESGRNDVLITHTGTLLYSFGLDTKPEGVAHVFRPLAGTAAYVGSLTPDEWIAPAGP